MIDHLAQLRGLLSTAEVLDNKHPDFHQNSRPWSKKADLSPSLVIIPHTVLALQKALKYLCDSDLDFVVRNTGTGSTSARDTVISMSKFKSFIFDAGTDVVTIGAGLDWGEVDESMEQHAPGYAVVGARCPWVGVTGSALVGGLSWLSHEFGMISDPQNLLDTQVVLTDGRCVWSSEEPDLDWALRGGGGNFGVVRALKLQARPFPSRIFAGVVTVPYTSLQQTSEGVAAMHARPTDPKVAMHVVNQGPGMGMPEQGAKPGMAFMLYDARGEAHARSEAGFGWIWTLVGAQEVQCGEMSLRQLHAIAETFRDYEGTNYFWLCAPLIADIDNELLTRAWKWYEDSVAEYHGLGAGSNVLLEFMQEPAFGSTSSPSATGWPHSGRRHVMQLALGCRPEGAPSNIQDIVMARLRSAAAEIAGAGKVTGDYHAGFLHGWNDLSEVYGENLKRLQEIKKKYDPHNKFNKAVDLFQETNAATSDGHVA